MDETAKEVKRIMDADKEKIDGKVVRATIDAPILNQTATREPSIREVMSGYYNPVTGINIVHPIILMGMMADECPWVDLAVRTIGSACSSTTPLMRALVNAKPSYKKKREDEVDNVLELLRYPNPQQTGYNLFRTIYENLALFGNAFLQVIKNKKGGLHSFYTLPPETMRSIPYFDEYNILHFAFVQVGVINEPKVFLEDEIIHFKLTNQRSFAYGKPPMLSQLTQIATSINAKKAVASWFQEGFVGGAIFKMDADVDVAERNRSFLREFFTKPENFGRTMVLEGSMDLVDDGNKFKDFDFSALASTSRDDILMAVGVPLSQAGVRSASGQANEEVIVAEEKAFVRNTVEMYHKTVFSELNMKLFRQILDWHDVEIGPGTLAKFSLSDSIETVKALASIGIQVNEARDLLSAPRVPSEEAGNVFVITTNNGVVKAQDTLGVDLNTGKKTPTIFDEQMAGAGKSAHGLGGALKKKIENKEKAKPKKD